MNTGDVISMILLAILMVMTVVHYVFSGKTVKKTKTVYRGVDFEHFPYELEERDQIEWLRVEKQKSYRKDPRTGKKRMPSFKWAQETLKHWQAYRAKLVRAKQQPRKPGVEKNEAGGWVAPLPSKYES